MPPWLLAQIVSAVVTSIAGVIVGVVSQKLRSSQQRDEQAQQQARADAEAMKRGMIALLRQKLIEIHEKYVIKLHRAPIEIKRQSEDIYNAYHSLGGNGTGTHLWEEIRDVHIDGDEGEKQ